MEKIRLENCQVGDYIKVLKDGNGTLKDLAIGKKYYVEIVAEKGKIEYGMQNSKIMFRIRNDKNKVKWYATTMECWFQGYR